MRRLALLALLAACSRQAPTSAPASPDAAVAPKADAACQAQVAELAVWMGKLAAAGRVELDFGAMLVETDLPAGWVARTDSAELRPGFAGAWDATEGIRDYTSDHLADAAAMKARLAVTLARKEAPEDDGEGLRVDIDRDATWAQVVEFAGAAREAGYRRLHLVFKAKSPVPRPPPSAVHEQLKSTHDAGDVVWKTCKQVRSYYYGVVPGKRSDRELAEDEARGIPAAILACACAVDLASAREQLYVMDVGNGTHRAAATLVLGDEVTVRQPDDQKWSAAAPTVLEAARTGKPVRLAMQVK